MSVSLRKRPNADGTTSLVLDIYHDGKRSYEFLKELKLSNKRTPLDKLADKAKLDQAKEIALRTALKYSSDEHDLNSSLGSKTDVVSWMQKSYIDKYTKKDKRNMQGALNRFKDFLAEENLTGLTFKKLSETVIMDYRDYLSHHSQGEGARSYFQRFKKMIKQAIRDKLITVNPALDVKAPKGDAKIKDTLTPDEIGILYNTPTESDEIKRAFLFCCMTGLRWIEVKNLTWKDISIRQNSMRVMQTKTLKEKNVSLNSVALEMLGNPGKDSDHVFTLPTANGANKTVKAWVKRSGIDKKISWHCARHTAGTNMALQGIPITTIGTYLGHQGGFRHTTRYTRVVPAMIKDAADKLNINLTTSRPVVVVPEKQAPEQKKPKRPKKTEEQIREELKTQLSLTKRLEAEKKKPKKTKEEKRKEWERKGIELHKHLDLMDQMRAEKKNKKS